MKRRIQNGVLLVMLVGGLAGMGCSDSTQEEEEGLSPDIPETEFELFAGLIRNIDAAQLDLEAARKTRNRVTIARAQAMLDQRKGQLDALFIQKYGQEAVSRWRTTVRMADNTLAKQHEESLRGEELLMRFKAVGATGRLDAEGFLVELDCKHIVVPGDLMARIGNCRKLKRLGLRGSKFEDSQFVHLASLTQLVKLDLSDNPVKGDQLGMLGGLSQLEDLDLSNTLIGDDKVPLFEALGEMENRLRIIDIENTKITLAGYEKITKAFKQAVVKQP